MYSSDFLAKFADNHSLTEAQYSMLLLRFEQGKSNKQIAEELGIDISAVNHRMGGIYKKLCIEGDTKGKDIELRKYLNAKHSDYYSNAQIQNTSLDLQHIYNEIQQLKAKIDELPNILKDVPPCISRYPSCPYLENNSITANINISIEKLKTCGQEKDFMIIIDKLGEIFKSIAINPNSEYERYLLNKILEFLRTESLEKSQFSVLEPISINKPELNIDAEIIDTV